MICHVFYPMIVHPAPISADVLGPRLHARARGRERESKVDILKNLLKYFIILTAPLDILTIFTTLTADTLFSPVRSLFSGMRTFNCLASDFLRGEVSSDFFKHKLFSTIKPCSLKIGRSSVEGGFQHLTAWLLLAKPL